MSRPATSGMPWIPSHGSPSGVRQVSFAAPKPSTALRTALWARRFCAVPVSEYGKDKLEVCRRAGEEAKALGIDYIHARIFSVYGPGDHPWSLVSTCLNTFLKGGRMELGHVPSSGISFM